MIQLGSSTIPNVLRITAASFRETLQAWGRDPALSFVPGTSRRCPCCRGPKRGRAAGWTSRAEKPGICHRLAADAGVVGLRRSNHPGRQSAS